MTEPNQAASQDPLVIHDPRIPLEIFSDGEEPGDLIVHGLPESVGLSAGTFRLDGSWSVPADQTQDLCLMPPADFEGTLEFRLEARFDGVDQAVEQAFAIEVRRTQPVPLPPTGAPSAPQVSANASEAPTSPLAPSSDVLAGAAKSRGNFDAPFAEDDRSSLENYVAQCYGDVDFERNSWNDEDPEDAAMLDRLGNLLESLAQTPAETSAPQAAAEDSQAPSPIAPNGGAIDHD